MRNLDGDAADHLVVDNSGDGDVASALAAPATTSLDGRAPKWRSNRIGQIDLNSGGPARLFEYLAEVNSPRSRVLLEKFDVVADVLDLEDEFRDMLVEGLMTRLVRTRSVQQLINCSAAG